MCMEELAFFDTYSLSHVSAVFPGGNVRFSTAISLTASLPQDHVFALSRDDNDGQLHKR